MRVQRTKAVWMAFLCALALVVMPACVRHSANVYSGSQVQSAHKVDYGTVVSINYVQIDDDVVWGPLGGAVIGGVLGSTIGHGRGRTLAALGGALVGAGAGYAGEKAINQETGLEIEVQLESGSSLLVVQSADEQFSVGERVRVLQGKDGSARVTRAPATANAAPAAEAPAVQTYEETAQPDGTASGDAAPAAQ